MGHAQPQDAYTGEYSLNIPADAGFGNNFNLVTFPDHAPQTQQAEQYDVSLLQQQRLHEQQQQQLLLQQQQQQLLEQQQAQQRFQPQAQPQRLQPTKQTVQPQGYCNSRPSPRDSSQLHNIKGSSKLHNPKGSSSQLNLRGSRQCPNHKGSNKLQGRSSSGFNLRSSRLHGSRLHPPDPQLM